MDGYLNFSDPGFSTRGAEVIAARSDYWCARTPYGLAVLRHRQVGELLRSRHLRQGSFDWPRRHDLTGDFAEFWEGSVIAATGARHKSLRNVIVPVLTTTFVERLVPEFDEIAQNLCKDLNEANACEFMEGFAIPFAGQAIATLLGLRREDWRQISHDASDLGLAMGVTCKSHEARINAACRRLSDLAVDLIANARAGHDPAGLIGQMVTRFDASEGLSAADLVNLIVITIFGGVDTTRSQLGLGLSLLINAPEQWRAMRADRSLVSAAIEEMIRQRPTTTWVTRAAVDTFEHDGVTIEAGTTLHLLVHASATDPAVGADGIFDATKDRKSHFGFGGGAHHCIGHLIARTDMAAALRALIASWETVEFDGEATWLPDSGNTAPVSLPIRYRLAQSD